MYILLSNSTLDCLGHELHLARFFLFDLLQKNKITLDDIVVTMKKDRFFLYDKMFKNTITWDDYCINHINEKSTVLNLVEYSKGLPIKPPTLEFEKINYHCDQFEKTPILDNWIKEINLFNLNEMTEYKNLLNDDFIVIHVRSKFGEQWCNFKESSSKLPKIIEKIREKTQKNIILFSFKPLNCSFENVYYINDLKILASFLSKETCKLFLSEWSGAGQLSQYCCNSKVVYYFDAYPSMNYENIYIEAQKSANGKDPYSFFDFKCVTNCERFYYKTYDQMLENLHAFI
jgi:hypothetical protein